MSLLEFEGVNLDGGLVYAYSDFGLPEIARYFGRVVVLTGQGETEGKAASA